MVERNHIEFCKDNYESEAELWKAISTQIKLLTDEEYSVLVHDEEKSVYIVEFAHNPWYEDWGCARYMLVSSDEEDMVFDSRDASEISCKHCTDGCDQDSDVW